MYEYETEERKKEKNCKSYVNIFYFECMDPDRICHSNKIHIHIYIKGLADKLSSIIHKLTWLKSSGLFHIAIGHLFLHSSISNLYTVKMVRFKCIF